MGVSAKRQAPRLLFSRGCPSWDASCFWLLYQRDQPLWALCIRKRYPSLGDVEDGGPQEVYQRIRVEVAKLYKEHRKVLARTSHAVQSFWDTINAQWMQSLAEILETEWTPLPDVFSAYMGFSPLCPRSLVECCFAVPYFLPLKEIVRICAHETVHFLYFAKLKIINPEMSEREFSLPNRQWFLSEVIAPVILNDPRAVQVIGRSQVGSYVCSEALSANVADLYQMRLKDKLSFEDFYQRVLAIELRSEDIAPKFRAVLR
jgi:hypothetical protein